MQLAFDFFFFAFLKLKEIVSLFFQKFHEHMLVLTSRKIEETAQALPEKTLLKRKGPSQPAVEACLL